MLVLSLRFMDSPNGSPSLEVLSSVGALTLNDTAGFFDVVSADITISTGSLPAGTRHAMRLEFSDFDTGRTLPSGGDNPSYIYAEYTRPGGAVTLHSIRQGGDFPYGPPWYITSQQDQGDGSPTFFTGFVLLPSGGEIITQEGAGTLEWTVDGAEILAADPPSLPEEAPGDHRVLVFCITKLQSGTRYPSYMGDLNVYIEPVGDGPSPTEFWTDFVGAKERV